MDIQKALTTAIKKAKSTNEWLYIVKDGPDQCDYQIADEYDLDTFYLGLNPRYAIGPDGEVN